MTGASVSTEPSETPAVQTDPLEVARLMRANLPLFTESGFEVAQTPPSVHERLAEAYSAGLAATQKEGADPNYVLGSDPDYIDIGALAYDLGEELRELHEAWAGTPLQLVASYGLRIYRRGQSLRWHADRAETHVISSIVHIDHESDEPWPLHIESHQGFVNRVNLEPGQMLFYESATCPHARPTPFNGEHYGSLFVHFKPVSGWDYTAEDIARFGQLERGSR